MKNNPSSKCVVAGATDGKFAEDFTTGTAGAAMTSDIATVPQAQMQSVVQKILDDSVASGAQTAAQCCVYIEGQLVVDAWAGTMAADSPEKITGDSLFPIYSTEKPMFATAVHLAHEEGLLDYEAPVCRYWPEFAGDGKELITMRHLLGHRTGLPGSVKRAEVSEEQECDWDFMVDWCQRQQAMNPGQKSAYLGITWGWFLGEPLVKIFGKPLDDILREKVLVPCGIDSDFFFAVPESEMKRIVTVYNGKENYNFENMNKACYRRACVPSAYGVANARTISKFHLRLSGQDGRTPLLRPETLRNALQPNRWEGEPVPDEETLCRNWQTVWGLGYSTWGHRDELDRIMGSGGLGGSEGFCDFRNRICIGYTCAISATACGKPYDLRSEIYRAVGLRTRYTQ